MNLVDQRIVIIGGGQAGFQTAHVLRTKGHQGRIDILAAEAYLPYQRPPLSKAYLEGKFDRDRLFLRPKNYYEKQDISVHLQTLATKINKTKRRVETQDGKVFPYDKLVLATGARLRKLPASVCPQVDGVSYLKGIDDAAKLQKEAADHKSYVVIGGGFIGLETAATLTKLGKSVTVIEAQETLIPGLSSANMAQFLKTLHAQQGTHILTNTVVEAITNQGGKFQVRVKNHAQLQADAIVIGIGVIPNTQLGQAIGLTTDRGFCVDAQAKTNDPDIYAVGDCAHGINMRYGRAIHIESVQNAIDQGAVAAHDILGEDPVYNAVAWFWSDQYHIKLQMAGLAGGHDHTVTTGDEAQGKFTVFFFKDEKLIAVHTANNAGDHMAARRIFDQMKNPSLTECQTHDFNCRALMKL